VFSHHGVSADGAEPRPHEERNGSAAGVAIAAPVLEDDQEGAMEEPATTSHAGDAVPAPGSDYLDRYFELQSEFDFTKHLGALKATDELADLCGINAASRVLDVGCGVGMTGTYLAKRYGCYVVGIDKRPGMIARARERATREGLHDLVENEVGDALAIPFEHDAFDVVLCESVLPFIEDQAGALSEMRRVLKPGGHVGITETAWLKLPPVSLVEELQRSVGYMEVHSPAGWKELIESAGFVDVVAFAHEMTLRSEGLSRLQRYGVLHFLEIWGHAIKAMATRPDYREFLKTAAKEPKDLAEYWGYVVAIGRKEG